MTPINGLRLDAILTEFGDAIWTGVVLPDVALKVIPDGLVSDWLFVAVIVETPTVLSVNVDVPKVCPAGIVIVVGLKVPAVAEGVMVTLTGRTPFSITVSVAVAGTFPLVGAMEML